MTMTDTALCLLRREQLERIRRAFSETLCRTTRLTGSSTVTNQPGSRSNSFKEALGSWKSILPIPDQVVWVHVRAHERSSPRIFPSIVRELDDLRTFCIGK